MEALSTWLEPTRVAVRLAQGQDRPKRPLFRGVLSCHAGAAKGSGLKIFATPKKQLKASISELFRLSVGELEARIASTCFFFLPSQAGAWRRVSRWCPERPRGCSSRG